MITAKWLWTCSPFRTANSWRTTKSGVLWLKRRHGRPEKRRRSGKRKNSSGKLKRRETVPEVGKKMVVVKGRKVPKGTEGTVAYVNREGSVLLKKDHEWQDRKAQGVWVTATYLKARRLLWLSFGRFNS